MTAPGISPVGAPYCPREGCGGLLIRRKDEIPIIDGKNVWSCVACVRRFDLDPITPEVAVIEKVKCRWRNCPDPREKDSVYCDPHRKKKDEWKVRRKLKIKAAPVSSSTLRSASLELAAAIAQRFAEIETLEAAQAVLDRGKSL